MLLQFLLSKKVDIDYYVNKIIGYISALSFLLKLHCSAYGPFSRRHMRRNGTPLKNRVWFMAGPTNCSYPNLPSPLLLHPKCTGQDNGPGVFTLSVPCMTKSAQDRSGERKHVREIVNVIPPPPSPPCPVHIAKVDTRKRGVFKVPQVSMSPTGHRIFLWSGGKRGVGCFVVS